MNIRKSSGKYSTSVCGVLPAAAVEDSRVVLDAIAVTQLAHHLHVEPSPLLDALRLQQLIVVLKYLSAPPLALDILKARSILSAGVTKWLAG